MAMRSREHQLLTPATSQSEASSNTDIALQGEKKEMLYTTRRVTRSSLSLGGREDSDATERGAHRHGRRPVSDEKTRAVSEKTLMGPGEGYTSRPAAWRQT
jgi:hypothetical protein